MFFFFFSCVFSFHFVANDRVHHNGDVKTEKKSFQTNFFVFSFCNGSENKKKLRGNLARNKRGAKKKEKTSLVEIL